MQYNRKALLKLPKPDFRLLFESAPGLLLAIMPDDPVFTMAAASAAYVRRLGIRREDLIGRGVFEVFPDNPGDPNASGAQNLRDSFQRAIATRAPDQLPVQRYDVERTAAQGGGFEERYWIVRNIPVLGPDGNVQYLLNSVEEVTEQVLAERRESRVMQELFTSRAPFGKFAETSPFGLVIGDFQGGFSYLNANMRAILGYTQEEVAAGLVRWDLVTPPDFVARDAEAMRELLTNGSVAPYEKVFIAKDGRRIPILIGAYRMERDQGPPEIAAFVLDLTKQKQLERDRQRLASVVENSKDFIGISDSNAVPIYVNKAGRELVGARDFEECRNTLVMEYFVPDERAFVQEVVLPAAIKEGAWRGELHFRHFRTGEAIPVFYDVFRVDDPETGQAINFATVTRDLRDRKLAERRDALLVQLDSAIRLLDNPDEIAQVSARLLGEELQADRCTYFCFKADQDMFEITHDYTRAGVASMVGRYLLSQFGEGAHLIRANLPWQVDDIEGDPRTQVRDAHRQFGIRAIVRVPLFQAGRLVAGMAVHQQTPRRWRPEEVKFLRLVVNRCWEGIERARAETHLRQQWQTFDTALAQTSDLVYTVNLEGRLTYVNRALLSLWEKSLDEAIGKNLLELGYPPGLAERLQSQIQQVIDRKQPLRDQSSFAGATGEIRAYEYILVPVLAQDGRVEGVAGSTRDITERNRTEHSVEEGRQLWQKLLMETPAAIAVLRGPDHRFEWVNEDYIRLVGRPSAKKLLGKPVREVLPGVASQGYLSMLDLVYQTGEPHVAREALALLGEAGGDVQEVYVNFVCVATRNRIGDIDGTFVHGTDVTDLVRARKEVEDSERQFRTLAESIPHLVWMADETGHIFWYNRRWYDYTGTTLTEMEGWGWQKVHDPKVLPGVLRDWNAAIASGDPVELHFPLRGADGTFRAFLTRIEPVKDLQGRVIRWFGTNTDIAEQRRTEEELRKMNRELEEFAYVASHDLQEPLRMVNIYTQLILEHLGGDDETLNEYAGYVGQGVTRMERLIRDLLTFSRAIQPEELPAGTADLSASLAEALSVLRERIEESGATISAQPLPRVRGDARQLALVFQNLLANALKYRNEDVPSEIFISAVQDADQCVVSVRDNGIGFDQQYAERIFGLFKRLHKDKYPGTGLGLAICKRILERYGGRIWAEGRPGQGATLYFAIPGVKGS